MGQNINVMQINLYQNSYSVFYLKDGRQYMHNQNTDTNKYILIRDIIAKSSFVGRYYPQISLFLLKYSQSYRLLLLRSTTTFNVIQGIKATYFNCNTFFIHYISIIYILYSYQSKGIDVYLVTDKNLKTHGRSVSNDYTFLVVT